MILLAVGAVVIAVVLAIQLIYFTPIENKYLVSGFELLFDNAEPAPSNGLAILKEKLLAHPLYAALQKFGAWPPDLTKVKFLQKNPFYK